MVALAVAMGADITVVDDRRPGAEAESGGALRGPLGGPAVLAGDAAGGAGGADGSGRGAGGVGGAQRFGGAGGARHSGAGGSSGSGHAGDAGGSRACGGAGGPRSPAVLADGGFDVVVRSPGVSRYRPELVAAAKNGAVVTTLTALWLEDFGDGAVLAVTGSKGKTTTAMLAAAALRAAGRRVAVAGNMGRPLAELYSESADVDTWVVEVSSFQAAEVTVSPPFGVLTLLAPDHLDWHGSYERYVADKLNLFAHRPSAVLAVNATDPAAWAASERFTGRTGYGAAGDVVAVRTAAGGGLEAAVDGQSYLDAGTLERTAFGLRGEHNLVNLCGALTATNALAGAVPDAISLVRALDDTPALPSRLRTVAVAGDLELVDDALASNPAGAVAALRAFAGRRLCLIAGGADRGVPFGPLVDELLAARPEPAVVVLGPAGQRLASELAARAAAIACRPAGSVEEAVGLAVSLLGGCGTVLFSPAAPTPPGAGSYVDRSASFAAAARVQAAAVAAPGPGLDPAQTSQPPC